MSKTFLCIYIVIFAVQDGRLPIISIMSLSIRVSNNKKHHANWFLTVVDGFLFTYSSSSFNFFE